MKQNRYFIFGLGLIAFLSSCSQKDFTPETGNTKVEFVAAETFAIENKYFYIPVRQVEESSTASVATLELESAYALDINGNPIDCVEDSVLIFTSKQIYVGPSTEENIQDGTFATASFELSIPEYRAIDTLAITVKLVGENVGVNNTMTYTFKSVEQYNILGTFSIQGFLEDPDTGEVMAITSQLQITQSPEDDNPLIYRVSIPTQTVTPVFKAERYINRLVVDGSAYTDESGNQWMLYSYDGTSPINNTVELTFSSPNLFVFTSGIYFVDSQYLYFLADPGSQGGRI